jgi:hypothetical protein
MKVTIQERRELPGVSSASGLARVGNFYFIIGDGSTELTRLDLKFNVLGTTHLYDPVTVDEAPGAKKQKRDLEVVTKFERNGRIELLCFGSGSKSPLRDVIYRVDVTNPETPIKNADVSTVSLYQAFRATPDIVGTEKLNIEGAMVHGDKFYIFQRGNRSGINPMIEIALEAFVQYLSDQSKVPSFKVHKVKLPLLWDNPVGFSDAVPSNENILFSGSVEVKTENPMHASFFGLLRPGATVPDWCEPVKDDKGEIAHIKIEGLAIVEAKDGSFVVDGVTDPDGGVSELIKVKIGK